jgi:hypothetical protein
MKNSVFVLWLEGVNPSLLSQVPAVSSIAASGADLQLTPAPLVEKSGCDYQILAGMKPGKLGHFDSVYPEKYQVYADTTVPYGAAGRLLPDILRSRKLATTFLEAKDGEPFAHLVNKPFDCAILRLATEHADVQKIDAIVRQCTEIAGPESHFLLLTDVASEEPRSYVNINDFLADIGLIDVGVPRNHDRIIWPQTLAYGVGAGQVWVNLSGRESQGSVGAGDEYAEVCAALIQELSTNWRDPVSNELIVQQVLSREDVFAGDYVFKAPDLAVVFQPGYAPSANAMRLDFDGKSVSEGTSVASAAAAPVAPYARLIASGPNIAAGAKGTGMLVDVMPSLLYLLNQPVPEDIDGTIISSLFTETYRKQTPVRYVEGDEALLSNEEEGVIVDRLRDLGYI